MEEEKKELQSLTNLLNPPFTFQFGDKEFQIRKANIKQVQQYQLKLDELSKDKETITPVKDLNLLAYSLFLVLSKADSSITEDFVIENMPGNVDAISLLAQLGFINPQRAKLVQNLQEKILSENSSQ